MILQQRAAAVAILDIGGMRLDKQGATIGVDQRMAFLDALAVDDGGARVGPATDASRSSIIRR